MEFFIPGLLLFLVSIIITAIIAPTATPMITAILSILFLTYGIYDHYQLFASEYRLSTWQDGIKIYAPFLMIGAIIIFSITGMFAFFTKGEVPVPSIPNIPAMSNATAAITNVGNKLVNNVSNMANTVSNTVTKTVNNMMPTGNNKPKTNGLLPNLVRPNAAKPNAPKPNANRVSPSLFETV